MPSVVHDDHLPVAGEQRYLKHPVLVATRVAMA